jgi:acetoin utilization protein AcuB
MYVKNRMTANPYTLSPDATVEEALSLMKSKDIRRIPVVKNGKLMGIITERKLLEFSPSPATSLSVYESREVLSKTKIETIMSKNVITVSPDNLVEEAALKMRVNDIGGIPVLDKDKVVGIITETDIFDAFIELMGFRDVGSRLTVEAEDSPGILADIAMVIKNFGVNITHLAISGGGSGRSSVVIRVNTLNTDEMIKTLESHGYKVVSVLKNENK